MEVRVRPAGLRPGWFVCANLFFARLLLKVKLVPGRRRTDSPGGVGDSWVPPAPCVLRPSGAVVTASWALAAAAERLGQEESFLRWEKVVWSSLHSRAHSRHLDCIFETQKASTGTNDLRLVRLESCHALIFSHWIHWILLFKNININWEGWIEQSG